MSKDIFIVVVSERQLKKIDAVPPTRGEGQQVGCQPLINSATTIHLCSMVINIVLRT